MLHDKQLDRTWLRQAPTRSTQDKIARFFALMTPGSVMTSNFIALCEVSSAENVKSVKCRACRGLGFRDGDPHKIAQWQSQLAKPKISMMRADELREKLRAESECKICVGTGYRTKTAGREPPDSIATTVRCGRCRGSGEVMNEDLQDVCPRCQGDMCVVPQTVRSKGSTKKGKMPKGATVTNDDAVWLPPETAQALPELHETAAVVAKVRRESAELADAMRLWHGPDGDKWAPTKWGRVFALWCETQAGKLLLAEAGPWVRRGKTPTDALAAERDAEMRSNTPNLRRRALIGQADKQARRLAHRMREAIENAEAAL